MKKALFAVLLVAALTTLFVSCKKGDDDPFISFRTRKARVVNSWTCKKMTAQYSYKDNSGADVIGLSYSGADMVITDSNAGSTDFMPYSLKLQFEKDGKFSAYEQLDSDVNMCEGTWNFNGKIGEDKNKESITINITKSTLGNDEGLFMIAGTTVTYKIKELRNKKMILTADSYLSVSADSYEKIVGEYTFE
jgi:hypothetical protein